MEQIRSRLIRHGTRRGDACRRPFRACARFRNGTPQGRPLQIRVAIEPRPMSPMRRLQVVFTRRWARVCRTRSLLTSSSTSPGGTQRRRQETPTSSTSDRHGDRTRPASSGSCRTSRSGSPRRGCCCRAQRVPIDRSRVRAVHPDAGRHPGTSGSLRAGAGCAPRRSRSSSWRWRSSVTPSRKLPAPESPGSGSRYTTEALYSSGRMYGRRLPMANWDAGEAPDSISATSPTCRAQPAKSGFFEMTFIAPPSALRPYRAPCGPRSTSTRSTSNVSKRAKFLPPKTVRRGTRNQKRAGLVGRVGQPGRSCRAYAAEDRPWPPARALRTASHAALICCVRSVAARIISSGRPCEASLSGWWRDIRRR